MRGFAGRDEAGRRVRVNLDGDRVAVMRNGSLAGEGWPVVADGTWSWPGMTVRPDGRVTTTALDWHEVDGVRAEGGTLVADKATAVLDGALLLFPRTERVRGGVRRVVGLSLDGQPTTWVVAGTFSGCGCSGR